MIKLSDPFLLSGPLISMHHPACRCSFQWAEFRFPDLTALTANRNDKAISISLSVNLVDTPRDCHGCRANFYFYIKTNVSFRSPSLRSPVNELAGEREWRKLNKFLPCLIKFASLRFNRSFEPTASDSSRSKDYRFNAKCIITCRNHVASLTDEVYRKLHM